MNRSLAKTNSRELNPWSMLRDDLWDVFERFSNDFDMPTLTNSDQFVPKIEVKDTGKTYQIHAEVPGMDDKDINVTLRDNELVIEGEKKSETKSEDKKKGVYHSEFSYGRFYRAIPLSDDADAERVNATYKNGILSVEIDKLPEKAGRNKKIQINAGKAETPQVETKH